MNLSGVLSIGANGLNAASAGSQTASQNISNSATPGYTRQTIDLQPIPISQGGGVLAKGTTRVQDQYLEKRALGASSNSGDAQARVQTLSVLDTVFQDNQGGIGQALDNFESALSDFSTTPNSSSVRQVVLQRADELSQAFQQTSQALTSARVDANGRITDAVSTVNKDLDQIGTLNSQIVAATNVGQDASELQDKRDQLIRDVSSYVPVTTLTDKSGAVSLVMTSGSRTLVDVAGGAHHLIATPDATTGDVRISRQTSGALEDITSFFTSGSIGGAIAARDGALSNAQDSLDQLAYDISNSYNAVQAAGIGLDGNTGRNLFAVPTQVSGAAAAMAVSSDVSGHPDYLAAATDPNSLPGDNRNALALVGVANQNITSGGTATAQQAFSALVAAGGSALASAQDQSDYASSTLSQIDSMRQSVSGVSTDEEMLSLMNYQRAYQASLRVIETADSMMSDLLNMKFGG